jgi:hypothetical protein
LFQAFPAGAADVEFPGRALEAKAGAAAKRSDDDDAI